MVPQTVSALWYSWLKKESVNSSPCLLYTSAPRSHQGVISAGSGHINVHETGAVESLGNNVLAVPHKDGKLTAAQVEELYQSHVHDSSFEHRVQPKMVYISNPTEYGTLYSRKELEELSRVCLSLIHI